MGLNITGITGNIILIRVVCYAWMSCAFPTGVMFMMALGQGWTGVRVSGGS